MTGSTDAARDHGGPGALGSPGPSSAAASPLVEDPNPGLTVSVLHGVYDLIWAVAIIALSPWWICRGIVDPRFRRMAAERLGFGLAELGPSGDRPRVLVHGVSVGEVKASQSLVAAMREEAEVVISASTDTGMQVARQLYPDLEVVRFPLDPRPLVARFFRRVRPDRVVLMELEIWPNFLRVANRRGIPVAIVNGRITRGSFRNYLRFRSTLPQFNRISLFAAQDEAYAERFSILARSDERAFVTGNVKVDGLRTGPVPRDEAFDDLLRLTGARPGQVVLVAGSTHDPEEVAVYRAFEEADPEARIVLVPRHPERAPAIIEALAAEGTRAQRLTEIRAGNEDPDASLPLVVDTIGELERIYGLATIVFVGGSLVPHGGHNMLEPAAQGLPVVYGPHVENFPHEAHILEEAGGARRVSDADDLARTVAMLLSGSEARERMAHAGIGAVEAQKGATERTLSLLRERCFVAVP